MESVGTACKRFVRQYVSSPLINMQDQQAIVSVYITVGVLMFMTLTNTKFPL